MNNKQRLTIRNSDGTVSQPTKTTFEKALYRLAEYEDLGYSPEELKQILSNIDDKKAIDTSKRRYFVQMIDVDKTVENDTEAPIKYKKLYDAIMCQSKNSQNSWYTLTKEEFSEYESYIVDHNMQRNPVVIDGVEPVCQNCFEEPATHGSVCEECHQTVTAQKPEIADNKSNTSLSKGENPPDFPSELFEFLMYIVIARSEADISRRDVFEFCSNATQSDIDNLRSIYNQFNERVDSVPDQTTAYDVSDLIEEIKNLVLFHRYKDGDIVNKVYILCRKKNTECDCPGKCVDCSSDSFSAHISPIRYTQEKANVLRYNCFTDRSSLQCKKAFLDLEHTVNLIKNVMDNKDRIKATVQYAYQDGGRFKARMSVTIGNKYAIHDVKIYDDPQNGLTVVMPMIRQKTGDAYVPVSAFHALDSTTSDFIKSKVLEAYKDYLEGN